MNTTSVTVVLGLMPLPGWTTPTHGGDSGYPRVNFNCENKRWDVGGGLKVLESARGPAGDVRYSISSGSLEP